MCDWLFESKEEKAAKAKELRKNVEMTEHSEDLEPLLAKLKTNASTVRAPPAAPPPPRPRPRPAPRPRAPPAAEGRPRGTRAPSSAPEPSAAPRRA